MLRLSACWTTSRAGDGCLPALVCLRGFFVKSKAGGWRPAEPGAEKVFMPRL